MSVEAGGLFGQREDRLLRTAELLDAALVRILDGLSRRKDGEESKSAINSWLDGLAAIRWRSRAARNPRVFQ